MEPRYERYMQFINSGSAIVPISYIAEVLGISYGDAVCDLQEMASLGYLGRGAYVNYKDRTLVLKNYSAEQNRAQNNNTQRTGTYTSQRTTQHTAQRRTAAQKTAPRSNVRYVAPAKASYKLPVFASMALIFGGAFLLLGGIGIFTSAMDMILYGYTEWYWIADAIQGLCTGLVGGGLLGYQFSRKKRDGRIAKYISLLSGKRRMDISQLADYALTPVKTVVKDLKYMIKKNLLGSAAHFSSDKESIVLVHDGDEVKKKETPKETPVEDRYDAILREIRQLDDDIADEAVSERIVKIEDITSKIFKIVKERPEKESEIKTFMSYYLPTTLKLLRSYSLFEKQGVKGENIDSTLADIERILDTLVQGFSQQLDQMFRSDALDISTDIEVLESMMQQDGLFSSGSAFKTMPEEDTEIK